MKIVLDTNSLIQSISFRRTYHAILSFPNDCEHVLCVSNDILEEYLEILQRLTDYETAELIVKTIVNSPFVELITPYYHFQMIQADPDDNKFVDCAIAAGARYVVTNDHHFDVLRQTPFPYVDVIALAEFAELLKRM